MEVSRTLGQRSSVAAAAADTITGVANSTPDVSQLKLDDEQIGSALHIDYWQSEVIHWVLLISGSG